MITDTDTKKLEALQTALIDGRASVQVTQQVALEAISQGDHANLDRMALEISTAKRPLRSGLEYVLMRGYSQALMDIGTLRPSTVAEAERLKLVYAEIRVKLESVFGEQAPPTDRHAVVDPLTSAAFTILGAGVKVAQ